MVNGLPDRLVKTGQLVSWSIGQLVKLVKTVQLVIDQWSKLIKTGQPVNTITWTNTTTWANTITKGDFSVTEEEQQEE